MIRFVGAYGTIFIVPWLWLGAGMMILQCVMAPSFDREGLSVQYNMLLI
jgi:hypothetical protein